MQIDLKKKRILDALSTHHSLTVSKLAQKLGISKQKFIWAMKRYQKRKQCTISRGWAGAIRLLVNNDKIKVEGGVFTLVGYENSNVETSKYNNLEEKILSALQYGSMTHVQLSKALGYSRYYIYTALRLKNYPIYRTLIHLLSEGKIFQGYVDGNMCFSLLHALNPNPTPALKTYSIEEALDIFLKTVNAEAMKSAQSAQSTQNSAHLTEIAEKEHIIEVQKARIKELEGEKEAPLLSKYFNFFKAQ